MKNENTKEQVAEGNGAQLKTVTPLWANGSAKFGNTGSYLILDYGHYRANLGRIFTVGENDERIAERIVACVNACEGLSNEMLNDNGVAKLLEDRDALLKEVERLKAKIDYITDPSNNWGKRF